jgi:hypothetical protein
MDVVTKGIARQYMDVIALTDNHDVFTFFDPSFAIIEMTVIGYVSFKTSQSLCRHESKFKELLHATKADLKYKQSRYGTYFVLLKHSFSVTACFRIKKWHLLFAFFL